MDFDGDGLDDMLSGSWPGELYLFRRQADGSFGEGEQLKDGNGKKIQVGSASAVFAADWDDDNDLDLVVGVIGGKVFLLINEGSDSEPKFGSPQELKAGGKPIKVPGGDSGPVVADWDGDGLNDLLVGAGDGSVLWMRNTGSANSPELASAKTLVSKAPSGRQSSDTPQPGTRAKICVTDYNGDGRLDLLLGDFSMRTPKERELSEDEQQKKKEVDGRYQDFIAQWTSAFEKASKEAKEADPDIKDQEIREQFQEKHKELVEKLSKLSQERSKFSPPRYEMHGHVWLFLRNSSELTASRLGLTGK